MTQPSLPPTVPTTRTTNSTTGSTGINKSGDSTADSTITTITSTSTNKNRTKQLDYDALPLQFKQAASSIGLEFNDKHISHKDSVDEHIVDNEGLVLVPLAKISSIQRKFIEEYQDPILNGDSWRYYDDPEDIVKLLSWLNPWGKRESSLRKELMTVKHAIISSMQARKKALFINTPSPQEQELLTQINLLKNRLSELESEAIKKEADEQAAGNKSISPDGERDDSNGIARRRAIRPRSRRGKDKLTITPDSTTEEVVKYGDINDINTKIKLLQSELKEAKEEDEINRVTEWVNSRALELFNKSLYEGGDKPKRTKRK
ncbi:hypothetical protein LELG_04793 [Lodderomyces elongisporus NRRL YB-4239]|uniref:WHIM2 domain-containing protein n=1 Tax=Lodderomyces elongisporus (strain ATCC 11503 / CBS 2605 / JCM 1781 / NBRC 1676 / NRRL YB-4239) TaxID=379508 RepID=A5E5A4_LODEL|nr:hypothetical protein LELG_04793 [Lodderomyces elongisporus NRRL YB-4239]